MLKVSIALTTYNGEKYIEKQLDSIRNQHRLPDEVIIVDDLSNDHTVKIIEDYISEHLLNNWKITVNEKNLGFKENFRKALSLVSGDICILCDQDDVWCEDKIETIVSLFSDDNVMGCSTGFSLIDSEDNDITSTAMPKNIYAFIKEVPEKPLINVMLPEIMHRNISPGCTCAYRKSVVDKFLAFGDADLPHDYQLNAISSALSGFYYYNTPLTLYRIHSENTLGLKPFEQTRLDIAKEKLSLSEVLETVSDSGKDIYKLCSQRYDAINNKSLTEALKLWFNKNYKIYYSFKERVGDLFYVMGIKNA